MLNNHLFQTMFSGMVDRCGGVDAAAAAMEAKTGTGNKGTVSKMYNGKMAVTVEAMLVMQQASGLETFTNYLVSQAANAQAPQKDILTLAAESARENGEAQYAVTLAFSSASPDPSKLTKKELSHAITQFQEARDKHDQILSELKRLKKDA